MSAFSVIVLFERSKSTAQHPLPDRDQRVIYPQPVVIRPVPVGVVVQPIYLHVPPGHAKNWSRGKARALWSTEREPSPRGWLLSRLSGLQEASTARDVHFGFHPMVVMTGRNWAILVAVLGAATLLRPPDTASQEACGVLRDEGLVIKVQAKLQFSPLWAKLGSVVVTSKECVVTLAGTVPEHANIVEAERVASSVQGVRRVRNTLRVASQ
ncbi:MAG: BON domain-containing protein [Burkholderiales bacterium]